MAHGLLARDREKFNPEMDEQQTGHMQVGLTQVCGVPFPMRWPRMSFGLEAKPLGYDCIVRAQ